MTSALAPFLSAVTFTTAHPLSLLKSSLSSSVHSSPLSGPKGSLRILEDTEMGKYQTVMWV